jgi:hypothetical protein
MRWFYYYPTWTKPSGGNKQLRLMAGLLTELGVENFLLRDRKFFGPDGGFDDNVFYNASVPLAPFPFEDAGARLHSDDVLILPEVLLETSLAICQGWKCRIALNNQNGFYGLRYAPSRCLCAASIEFAIANAPYVAGLCRDFHGIRPERIFEIPYWVARGPFALADSEGPRRLAVCYMPRKLADEGQRVRELVSQTYPEVPWVEIDGLSEDEVARRLRGNQIFFSAQYLEGFGLPALEAMACGSLVAGFAGTDQFAHPYVAPDNGLWAPDGDVRAAATAVCTAIDVVREGEARHQQYLAAGRRTAQRFTREPVLQALREMIDVVGDRNYRSRTDGAKGLGWRSTLFAYRLLYNYDRLGWAGRFVSGLSRSIKPLRTALSRIFT